MSDTTNESGKTPQNVKPAELRQAETTKPRFRVKVKSEVKAGGSSGRQGCVSNLWPD